MSATRIVIALAVLFASSSVAMAQEPPPKPPVGEPDFGKPGEAPPPDSSTFDEESGERFVLGKPLGIELTGFWLPWVALAGNKHDTVGPGEFVAHPQDGKGWGVRGAYALVEKRGTSRLELSIGVLYLESHHREDTFTNVRIDVFQGYADAELTGAIGNRYARVLAGIAGGIGGAAFNFDRGFHDTGGAAAECRLKLGFLLLERFEAGATVGLFLWGYPGTTLGQGGFAALHAGVTF